MKKKKEPNTELEKFVQKILKQHACYIKKDYDPSEYRLFTSNLMKSLAIFVKNNYDFDLTPDDE